MTVHNQVQNLLSQYVLNELEAVDKQRVEEHLAQCDPCRSELDCMRSVLSIADTMGVAQTTQTQQTGAVSDLHRSMETVSPGRVWFTSKTVGAIAAVVLIGVLLALVFMIWHPAEEKQIADPQPDQIQRPIGEPIDHQLALDDDQIAAELAQAKALFEAGNVQALAQLFESGSDDTKLAVANYLTRLDTNPSLEALQSLDVTDAQQDVIDAVNKTTATEGTEPVETSSSDPNALVDAKIKNQDSSDLAAQSTAGTDPNQTIDADNDKEGYIGIKVVAAVTGKPIEGASLRFRHYANGKKEETLLTDKTGRGLFELKPEKTSSLRIKVTAKGFVPKLLDWSPDSKGIPVPKQYGVKMNKSIPIGGFVKTKQGDPVEGASVEIRTDYATQYTEFDYVQETAKTDKDGRWYYHDFDPDPSEYYLSVEHPEMVSVERYSITPPMEQLKRQACVFLMQKGLMVSGRVTALDGTPVKGATIYQGYSRYADYPETQTDEQGVYQFDNCQYDQMILTIVAKGYAQDMLNLNLREDVTDADFVLEAGNTLTVRVEDLQGNPIEGATVEGRKWRQYSRNQQCESIRCKATTDSQGLATLKDLPADEVKYDIRKDGYASYREHPMTASNQGVVLTMYPKGRLFGKVYDAETKELISECEMIEGIRWQGQRKPTWQSHGVKHLFDGAYEQSLYYHTEGFAVKIQAEGYYPYESDTFYNEGADIELDIYLSKGDRITGIVYDSSGQPVADADVGVCPEKEWLNIRNGRLDASDAGALLKTDSKGQFILPPLSQTYALVAACDQGYAQVDEAEFLVDHEIHLSQWGRIEGTVYTGRNPAVNQEISIETKVERDFEIRFNLNEQTQVFSDDQGRFLYDRVIPGDAVVHKMVPLGNRSKRYANRTEVTVAPGQTETVHLGGGGRTVAGTFTRPLSTKFDYSQNNFDITAVQDESTENPIDLSGLPEPPFPEDIFTWSSEQMQAWQTEWVQTPEGQEFMQAVQKLTGSQASSIKPNYPVVIDEKGNFTIEDVLPGQYKVFGTFHDPDKIDTNEYYQSKVARVEFEVTVEETDDPNEFDKLIHLGSIPVLEMPKLETGQIAPGFELSDLSGKPIRLQDFRGDYVLIDLTGQRYLAGQADETIIALKEVYSTLNESDNVSIITCISNGAYPKSWTSVTRALQYFLDQKEIQWIVGIENLGIGEFSKIMIDYRIDGTAAPFVLIGPDGRLLETIDAPAKLMEILQKYLSPEPVD